MKVYRATGIPMAGHISHTKRAVTIMSRMLAGMPATKNCLVVNYPLE